MSEPVLYVATLAAAIGLMAAGLLLIGVAFRVVPIERLGWRPRRRRLRSRGRGSMAVPASRSTRPPAGGPV